MCICVHINIKTHQQENSKTLIVVRVTPGTLYCCYQSHSGQPYIPMSNSLWGAQSAASPVSTLVCYVLWSPDMMATVRICVATLRVEHPICRNIPNNTHLVLSHPPSLALEYWTCYYFWEITSLSRILWPSSILFFWGAFPFLTDTFHPGNLAHRSWPLLVEGKSLITGLYRMEHILFAKRRV